MTSTDLHDRFRFASHIAVVSASILIVSNAGQGLAIYPFGSDNNRFPPLGQNRLFMNRQQRQRINELSIDGALVVRGDSHESEAAIPEPRASDQQSSVLADRVKPVEKKVEKALVFRGLLSGPAVGTMLWINNRAIIAGKETGLTDVRIDYDRSRSRLFIHSKSTGRVVGLQPGEGVHTGTGVIDKFGQRQ